MLIDIIQIIISVLLMITILLQQRGGGLSGAFGGQSVAYGTRRGAEKIVFKASIVLGILFIASSLVRLFI